VVRSALGQAVKWGWIRRYPADHAEPGEILEEEVEPPADVDVVHLLAEAEAVDHRLALFLQLAIVTGARRGALCALRWNHLDLTPASASARFSRVIVIGPDGSTHPNGRPRTSRPLDRPASRTKRSGRKVALDPYVVAALSAHHDRQVERATAAGAPCLRTPTCSRTTSSVRNLGGRTRPRGGTDTFAGGCQVCLRAASMTFGISWQPSSSGRASIRRSSRSAAAGRRSQRCSTGMPMPCP
jgi:integrase